MEAMGDGVEEANATLLQQVEDLKLQCAMANKNRDQAEQNAILKLKAAQIDRQEDLEKLQEANALFSTTNERLQKIQNELSEERKEKEALSSQVEQHKTTTLTLKHQIEQLNQQCIENEVQAEKSAESVKKQYQKLLREKIQEEKRQWEISTMADRSQPLKSFAGYSSLGKEMNKTNEEADAKQMENGHEDKGKDRKPSPPRRRESASPAMSARSSLDGSYIGVSGHYPIASTIRVERLEATTRQLENQISFYQTQLQSTQQSREMLTMSLELDKLRKETKRTQDIEQQYQVLNQRYQASLEMLGERTEQVEELKADLDDVKEMYKLQTIELVQKIDQLSKK
ncbi:TATA element modulatory factor 1 TATA binding-domain-containing protein [Spinellus fusiger]|nr:TATA element modulatory factor 1 TATA binding-domain-containing protein [Spinellus fusiger]